MKAVEELRKTVDDFTRFVEERPEVEVVEKAWGSKEVLAHIIFYLEGHVRQIKALLAQAPFEPPQGRFDDLNAQAVAATRGVSVSTLLHRLQVATEEFCHFAQTLDPETIHLQLKKGDKVYPLSFFILGEADHIRAHQRILERQPHRGYLNDVEKLGETVKEFCGFISELPTAVLIAPAGSPKELLTHLVVWHETCVAQIEASLANQSFDLPRGTALQTRLTETNRRVSVAELGGFCITPRKGALVL